MTVMDYNRISFLHGIGGNSIGIGDYFSALDAAGRPAVVCSYDDYGVVKELLDLRLASGVPHICAFRAKQSGRLENPDYTLDPYDAAVSYWTLYKETLPPEFDRAVWLILANEGQSEGNDEGRYAYDQPHEWGDFWGQWSYHISLMAVHEGYRVLVGGWSAGTPQLWNDEDHDSSLGFWNAPGNIDFLRLCSEYPNAIGIAVHEGVSPNSSIAPYDHLINEYPYISGRFEFIFQVCDSLDISRPRIFVTECAWKYDEVPDPNWRMSDIVDASIFYGRYPEVLGVALWFLGPGHGGIAEQLHTSIPSVTNYSLTDSFTGTPIWPDLPNATPPGSGSSNVFRNPSFEMGWRDLPPVGSLINQEPLHWNLSWINPGEPMPITGVEVQGVPECVHKLASDLPLDEQPGGADPLILDGNTVFKVFHAGATYSVLLSTVIQTKINSVYSAVVPIRTHWHAGPNPDYSNCYVHVFVNSLHVDTFDGTSIQDRQWFYYNLDFTSSSDTTTFSLILQQTYPLAGLDFFIDALDMREIDSPVAPPELVAAARAVVMAHPSRVGIIQTDPPPLLRSAIEADMNVVASSEIEFSAVQSPWVAQLGREDGAQAEEGDVIYVTNDDFFSILYRIPMFGDGPVIGIRLV
jgi:hypothetical protein